MTDPTRDYPVTPAPPTSHWTLQDPYAPYAGFGHERGRSGPDPQEPYAGGPAYPPPYAGGPDGDYQPYAGGPQAYQPYAGGPGYGYGGPYGGQKPPAYWPLSIVGLLFSFLFGAIAIYFSIQVGRRWDRGDAEGARKASRTARILGIVAIIVGLIGTAILLGADSR